MLRTLIPVLLAAATVLPAEAAAPLTVVATVAPHAWLVERVGGDAVEVLTLVAPGQSPETHQPTDAQVSRVMRARVLFRAGVPMEEGAWFRALAASGRVEVVDLRRGVPMRRMEAAGAGVAAADGHADERSEAPGPSPTGVPEAGPATGSGRAGARVRGHRHDGEDPHTWTSPRRLALQARTVAAALAAHDPGRRRHYEAGLAAVERELDRLDRRLRETLRPLAGSSFFVFHPAWGYFADDYGLTQVAIETDGKDPSDRELTALVRQARRLGVRVIFIQPQIADRSARAVAAAVGARLEELDPLAADVPANLLRAAERLAAVRAGAATAVAAGGGVPAEGGR